MPSAEEIYLFRHAAYRDVAYRLQIPSDRAELHALALEIMERVFQFNVDKFANELAEHARLAREQGAANRDGLAEREARYLMKAVKRATEGAQWATVVMLSEHARYCPAIDAGGLLELRRQRAKALRELGRVGESEELWLEIIEEAQAVENEVVVLASLIDAASVRIARGAVEGGIALLEQAEPLALRRAREGSPELLAGLYVQRSLAATDYDETETWLNKAADAIAGDPESNMYAAVQGNIANHLGALGRHDEAVDTLRRLIPTFTRLKDPRAVSVAWANVGRQELLRGDGDAAEAALGNAIRFAGEVGNSRTEAFARANLATQQMRRGDFHSARLNIERAMEIARDHELRSYHASYLCIAAELELLLGHETQAQKNIEDARAEFLASGGEPFIVEYCGMIRLRIAASQAVTTAAPGRATSRLTAAPPSPMWLRIVRDLLGQIRAVAQTRGANPGPLLQQALQEGEALLTELESAAGGARAALVYRGYLPERMSPPLRAELRTGVSLVESATLKSLHPALWRALQS